MSVLLKQDKETNVVVTAMYIVSGVRDDITAIYDGLQQFTYTRGEFTPYEQLTEDQVIGWIQLALGENCTNSIYSCIDGQINSTANPAPTPQPKPLPWN